MLSRAWLGLDYRDFNNRLRGWDAFLVNGKALKLFKREVMRTDLYPEIKTEVLLLFRLETNGKLTGIYCNGLDRK